MDEESNWTAECSWHCFRTSTQQLKGEGHEIVNPLSPNSDQHQFSPKDIHRLSRDKVMRITKMIIIEKIPWSFIKFSQLILKVDVWRSVWRICMWILGLKGLTKTSAIDNTKRCRKWKVTFVIIDIQIVRSWEDCDEWRKSSFLTLSVHSVSTTERIKMTRNYLWLCAHGKKSMAYTNDIITSWQDNTVYGF